VTFAYEVFGKTYSEWYFAGSPHEESETFEILNDPLDPERNTGSGYNGSIRMRVIIEILGSALAAFLIWLEYSFN
jgi:hypothetical protein